MSPALQLIVGVCAALVLFALAALIEDAIHPTGLCFGWGNEEHCHRCASYRRHGYDVQGCCVLKPPSRRQDAPPNVRGVVVMPVRSAEAINIAEHVGGLPAPESVEREL